MKYCQNCGNTASDDAEYCSVCGTVFDNPRPGTPVSRETVYGYEKVPEPELAPVPEERASAPTTTKTKTKTKKTTLSKEAEDGNKNGGLTPTAWKCLTVIIIAFLLFYMFLFSSLDKILPYFIN